MSGGYFNGDKPKTIRLIAWVLFAVGAFAAISGILILLTLPVGVISDSAREAAEGVGLLAIAVATGSAGVALIRLAKDL